LVLRRAASQGSPRRFLRESELVENSFGIQRELVSEVIIDSRDIRACTPANLANCRTLESAFAEHLSRRLKQLGFRTVRTVFG
jgi:hypothetical protein